MNLHHVALILLGKLVTASSNAEDLYWMDLYTEEFEWWDYIYLCGSDWYTYSDEDCPFISSNGPVWVTAKNAKKCKKLCDNMNKDWNREEDPTPPCTSVSFDELESECALRRCTQFPIIIAEDSSTHEQMGEKYMRYKTALQLNKPIQDYFLNIFDPDRDSRCYPGETLRRVTEQELVTQNPGSYVCELDGTSEFETDLPNEEAENPEYREKIPPSFFWDSGVPTFDGCWEGMDDAVENGEYLTYSWAIRLDYKWQLHYKKYKKEFKRHGYNEGGVERTVQMLFDQVNWIFREQFQINMKYNHITLQQEDGSWPENPWLPGDAGVVLFTGDYNGGAGFGRLCMDYELLVGGVLFKDNDANPKFPLYSFENVFTLAHEFAHHMGHGHNPVYMPDILVGDGELSYRRCDDPNNPGQKKRCLYKSFLSFTDVDPTNNYVTRLCDHVRSEQGQCCASVEPLDTPSPSLRNLQENEEECDVGKFLCPSGGPCKYKGGGIDNAYTDKDRCPDGYEYVRRERDEGDPSVFSQASKDACFEALGDMQSMGIDVHIDSNSCPMYLHDKPAGCFITCRDGKMFGYFNENAWNSIENKYNDKNTEPVCIDPNHPQTCKKNKDCDDGDPCTTDKCGKNSGVCRNIPNENCCKSAQDCNNTFEEGKCTIYKCKKKKGKCVVKKTVDCKNEKKCLSGKCA